MVSSGNKKKQLNKSHHFKSKFINQEFLLSHLSIAKLYIVSLFMTVCTILSCMYVCLCVCTVKLLSVNHLEKDIYIYRMYTTDSLYKKRVIKRFVFPLTSHSRDYIIISYKRPAISFNLKR